MVTLPAVEAARRWPTAPALLAEGAMWTHAELEAASASMARRLVACGVSAGDVVALWGANSPQWVMAAHAIGRVGATLLPLNTRWTDAEAAAPLERLAPRLLVGDASLAARAAALGFQARSFEDLEHVPPLAVELPEAMPASAPMVYVLTSGTTGVPKAVTLTWGQVHASATAVSQVLALGPADRWWLAMPLFHVGGLGVLWRCAWHGAAAVLAPRFAAEAAPEALADGGVTVASLVPTMLRGVLEALGSSPWPAAVRAVMLGGAAVPPDLVERCPVALATYGLSEAGSTVTLVPPGADAVSRATCGWPLPGCEVAILEPRGPEGEGPIAVRGPQVMVGYHGDPEATNAALQGGWLRTGDFGRLDAEGRLTVLARREDLIVSGGENIYPAEVEAALMGHPAVAACAVVAAPHPRWGQVPHAWVVPRAPVEASAIEAWLDGRLARFKQPRQWDFVSALPLLANGKVDRRALQAEGAPRR